MSAQIRSTFVLIFLLVFAPVAAQAAERVALVIGNSAYGHAPKLSNPRNDAEDVAATLERIGFAVTVSRDAGFDEMRQQLRGFAAAASGADIALVFFAGHGMEIDKQNYLVPVDARLESDRDISYEAIPIDMVTEAVSGARQLRLVLLDACRNNPFLASMKVTDAKRSMGRGLARIEPTAGTLVAFAAKEGTVADDGSGRNSPFTRALIDHFEQPGLEVAFLFRKVRDKVLEATNGRQEPFVYGSLPGRQIFLVEPEAGEPPAPGVSAKANQPPEASLELALWNEIKDSDDPATIGIYLKRYPAGVFAEIATLRLRRLEQQRGDSGDSGGEAAGQKPGVQTLANVERKEEPAAPGTRGVLACDNLTAHGEDRTALAAGVDFNQLASGAIAAVEACRKAVEQFPGDRLLEFQLARALHAGKSGEAMQHYRVAANAGHVIAQRNIGYALEPNSGAANELSQVGKDIAEAAKWYEKAATAGDRISQFKIARMYAIGSGVAKDEAKAVGWFRASAGQGLADAQAELAAALIEGKGGAVNHGEAVEWARKAALQDHPRGMNLYGYLFASGKGVAENLEEAVRWYRKAAEKGEATAQTNLARKYYMGQGVAKDYSQAFEWYLQGAKGGNADAMTSVGWMYMNGQGVARNYDEALKWSTKSAATGEPFAITNIGLLHEAGNGVKQDLGEARRRYEEAAAKGHPRAMRLLGEIYENGKGVPANPGSAKFWYERAAKEGDTQAKAGLDRLARLGSSGQPRGSNDVGRNDQSPSDAAVQVRLAYDYFVGGNGKPKDLAKAFELYRKAAEQGAAEGQYSTGLMYYNGYGVKRDYRQAAVWYEKAVAQGHFGAMNNLGVIVQLGQGGKKKNIVEARRLFEKAANGGDSWAQKNLAGLLIGGSGIAADHDSSISWYLKSLKTGNDDTLKELLEFNKYGDKNYRRKFQTALRKEGVYDGPLDGSFGPATQAALRKLAGK